MKTLLFQSADSWAPLIIRLILGIVLFAHGAQKMLGWFGGYGFTGSMNFFTQTLSLPYLVALFIILLEFFGPMLLLAGAGTRLVALAIAGLFLGIILTNNINNGFFMNWFNNQKGEGYEFSLLAIAMSLSLVLSGAGKLALDNWMAR